MMPSPSLLLILCRILLDSISVSAQSFPLFSQSSYGFTIGSCSAGTYIGQVSASGNPSYSTDNSFVISVSPSGALSLSATIAATTSFNVIARNQYGSTQASVTVTANCGSAIASPSYATYASPVSSPVVNYATYVSPVSTPVVTYPTYSTYSYNYPYTYNTYPYSTGFNTGILGYDVPVLFVGNNNNWGYNRCCGWNGGNRWNGNGRNWGNRRRPIATSPGNYKR
ncbi:uncharacterized protein LOC129584392 [Paramacrobiotus metropolitanus]|uniref:uncharacterized protein LOC129584392 n=1 Tax=Paramacrobiotus metropolitanus TaxID=2943436 RepID=UPI0024455FE5|nr:uncharacterized protein LOC129584392 [Paramacrobiotus metropolitanus]